MTTYQYHCDACGEDSEQSFPMGKQPAAVSCGCGRDATQCITGGAFTMVKGHTRPYRPDKYALPYKWHEGNTNPDRQEERYNEMIRQERLRVTDPAVDKKAIRNGRRKDASVPRELFELRMRQYGTSYWYEDTKTKLKEEGLYHHKD